MIAGYFTPDGNYAVIIEGKESRKVHLYSLRWENIEINKSNDRDLQLYLQSDSH